MIVTGNHSVCLEICDVLGIKNARKITLNMAVNEIVMINVEYAAGVDNLKGLIPILRKYCLMERNYFDEGIFAWREKTYLKIKRS